MAAKKQLELTPTELDEPADKTGVDDLGRRIELKTVGGGDHKSFSHETGTVKLEQDGIEEYRKKEEAEQQERMARAKTEARQKRMSAEDLRKITDNYESRGRDISSVTDSVQLGLLGMALVFAFVTVTSSLTSILTLAAVVAAGWGAAKYVQDRKISFRVVRIVARLLYGSLLIYLGIRGLLQLLDLYRHPPARGVSWRGFGSSALTAVTVVSGIVFMGLVWRAVRSAFRVRGELKAALRDPAHPLLQKHPALENPENLRNAVYALECLVILGVEVAITMLFLAVIAPTQGRDGILYILSAIPYTAIYLYLYPCFVHVFFRKVFFPVD